MALSSEKYASGAEHFFEALYDAGTRYCFVNLGSDHPAMIEAMIKAKKDNSVRIPEIITCPSELVALSAALGYAQVTGQAQAVIVHVDCGTLALGQSLHNASIGRIPVFIFAGLSPITQEGELVGSRTEFIHWLQDVPDQGSIVRQYCKYTSEIRTSRNIKQMINRALQIACSDPKGPVYLTASREALEEYVPNVSLQQDQWGSIVPSTLPDTGKIELIGNALISAKRPLVITTYSGRNLRNPPLLGAICDKLPIEVIETVGSELCIRSDHEAYRGMTVATHAAVELADVILVMDCDVPWVPTLGRPSENAKIFHVDVDPLKEQKSLYYINAHRVYRASCELFLRQLLAFINKQELNNAQLADLFKRRSERFMSWKEQLRQLEELPDDNIVRMPYLVSQLRAVLPKDSTVVHEAVTNAGHLIHHLNLTEPGSLYGSGTGGLGWLGGAALGIKLAKSESFVCAVVGDGTFLFSQMESTFWIARRYSIPILLIVLNNGGWNAPKVSTLLVHPTGLASKNSRKDCNISFEPSPNYPGIAVAAGDAWGSSITKASQVSVVLRQAVDIVKEGRPAVVEVRVPSMDTESLREATKPAV